MKTTSAIVLFGFLGLLGGCSTTPSEPAPGPSEKVAVVNPGAARTMGEHPTDVVASQLFTRPALDVARKLVQISNALPPTDVLGHGYFPTESTHTDTLHFVPKGIAGMYKVTVDTTEGEAYLFLGPQVEDVKAMHAALRDIEVLDPAGVKINERVYKGLNHDSSEDLPMSAIPLAGHPAGTYTVKFKSGAPQVGLAIEARLLASNIVMKLKPSTTQHLLGNQSFVDATLMEGSAPITGARVVADLVDGETNAKVSSVAFTEVGNGVYRAAVHPVLGDSHRVSAYLTDVRAEGTAPSGAPFFRHGRTGFHYGIPTARLGDIVAQRTLTDEKGLITALEVDVALENRSLDRLEISAKLTVAGADGQERPVVVTHTGDAYDAGKHVVTLRFDAGQLRLTKSEGTFYVRDLSLYSLGTNTLFHRQLSGQNRAFPAVSRAMLKQLPSLTPGQMQLVNEGRLSND